jgi:hypothetical protein
MYEPNLLLKSIFIALYKCPYCIENLPTCGSPVIKFAIVIVILREGGKIRH